MFLKHAHRVKNFEACNGDNLDYDVYLAVVDFLSHRDIPDGARSVMFPHLLSYEESCVLGPDPGRGTNEFNTPRWIPKYAQYICGDSLKSFTLKSCGQSFCHHGLYGDWSRCSDLIMVLSTLGLNWPRLERLSLGYHCSMGFDLRESFYQAFGAFVTEFHNLRSLCSVMNAENTAIIPVAELPLLRYWEVELWNCVSSPTSFQPPSRAFTNLQELDLAVYYSDPQRLIVFLDAIGPTTSLKTMAIESHFSGDETLQPWSDADLHRFMYAISRSSSLQSLSVYGRRDIPGTFTGKHLAHLLPLRHMRRFTQRAFKDTMLTDSDIQKMAMCWPELAMFRCLDGQWNSWLPPSRAEIEASVRPSIFAVHALCSQCPQLDWLEISMKGATRSLSSTSLTDILASLKNPRQIILELYVTDVVDDRERSLIQLLLRMLFPLEPSINFRFWYEEHDSMFVRSTLFMEDFGVRELDLAQATRRLEEVISQSTSLEA